MSTLEGTPFATAYGIFGVSDDNQLITRMSAFFGIGIIVVAVWSSSVKYGKLAAGSSDKKASDRASEMAVSARTAWLLGELPGFLFPLTLILATPGHQLWNFCNLAGLALFIAHFFNKSILYSRTISKEAKPVQISTFLFLIFGNVFNGFFQGHSLINVLPTVITPISYLGLILGFSGLVINKYHDYLLTSLRGNSSSSKTTTGYKIPRGGLFEYVSCANFFGEIIEWWGFALLCGGLPQLLMALETTVFLGHRALYTHAYYLKTFGKQYPSNRQVLIPYLF